MCSAQRIEELFQELIEHSTAKEREEYLDRVCGDDSDLRHRLEALVRSHEEAGSFLCEDDAGQCESTVDQGPRISESQRIGVYKLRELIGEGGMGSVYVAEQEKPLRRKVALKVIKPGMDSKLVLGRFEAERNALALMNHPNIAKVLDAGETGQGRPFFVMELVNGIPITKYCDDQKLTIRQRLELFADVCQAIQHAHQKGIIHRDIKPSNVLVTEMDGKPIAKVIDFGVAKALNKSLTEHSVYTAFQTVIGTPLYMSPEQASFSAVDVDTRSDVYSLGVLLYELLTGTTPFTNDDLKNAAQDEVFRFIRESEPPRPSNRISSLGDMAARVSQLRRTEPNQLGCIVKGDLDWIVMKAMAKERGRRYKTPDALSEDVQRHLCDLPIEARPPSVWSNLCKSYRRNRGLCIGVSATIVALLFGLAVALHQRREALRLKGDLENSVIAVGKYAIELALIHAFNGNREKTDRVLDAASQAQINQERIEVIKACVELYAADGEYKAALNKLRDLGKDDTNIAAIALAANAALWSGDFPTHYRQTERLQNVIRDVVENDREINLETRIFLGQACLFQPEDAIDILEPAIDRTNAPVAVLLLGQAQMQIAHDSDDAEMAKAGYENVLAAHHLLQDSSMAQALRVYSLHLAWLFDLDGLSDSYLQEAKRIYVDMDSDPSGPARIFATKFFADANTDNSAELDWDQVQNSPIDMSAPGRILERSPDVLPQLIQILESREKEEYSGSNGVSNSLLLLNALDRDRHSDNRERIERIDVEHPVLFQIDPRLYALMASIIMGGRSPKAVALAQALDKNRMHDFTQTEGLGDFVAGHLSERRFLSINSTGNHKQAMSEFLVAVDYIGRKNRLEALKHLERSMDASSPLGMSSFASAIHHLLRSNHPLLDWVK